jgi:hypothetical protein
VGGGGWGLETEGLIKREVARGWRRDGDEGGCNMQHHSEKRKEKREKIKEKRGKRKEEREKRKEERGKREARVLTRRKVRPLTTEQATSEAEREAAGRRGKVP